MKKILERLYQHDVLTEQEAYEVLNGIADKKYPEAQVAALLSVYNMRAIHVEELLGFRRTLVERAHPIDLSAYKAIDIVGTGGDGKNTFNISTCACFVVAGAGYKVAKHGNYGATSVSGASTVLEQHGVKFSNDADRLSRSIEASGVAYLHAPLFHPALAAVGPLRRALGVKTIFNLLGPLVNPCRPAYQLLGVATLDQMRLYTQTLQRLGIGFTVVNSFDGYDEISLTSDFKVMTNNFEQVYVPADLNFPEATHAELSGGETPQAAAAIFDAVLQDKALPAQRNCVIANAAVAIRTICPEKSLTDSMAEADESIKSGRAADCFKRFVAANQ
ncbi:MAG: anthranilate phosphoribosyltransferase [Bacteroidales bacterium]|nr:anthranilate phosphoribosyltransferase [Bacteroidales bacterium]